MIKRSSGNDVNLIYNTGLCNIVPFHNNASRIGLYKIKKKKED